MAYNDRQKSSFQNLYTFMMTDAPIKQHTPLRPIAQPATVQPNPLSSVIKPKQPPIQPQPKVIHSTEQDVRAKRDMMFLRKQRLKEMLDEEMEEYKFELVSRKREDYPSHVTDQSVNLNAQSIYPRQSRSQSSMIQPPSYQVNPIGKKKALNEPSSKYYPEPQPNYYNKNQYMMPIEPRRETYEAINGSGQIGFGEFDVNRELDFAIKKYADNLDKLKVDEFMSRKKIQDDLLKKINSKLVKINHEMNDKIYQENIAEQRASNYQHPPSLDNIANPKPLPTPIYNNKV